MHSVDRRDGFLLRLRLVTSQGSPYPSRSPRAHPSGWTRTQGLSRMGLARPPLCLLVSYRPLAHAGLCNLARKLTILQHKCAACWRGVISDAPDLWE